MFLSLFIRELKDYSRLFSKEYKNKWNLVFYSERDIYYLYYEGTLQFILEHSDLHICYITSDPNDPVFSFSSPRFHPFYINYLIVPCIKNIDCRALVMTMPDLDQYHIKRSTKVSRHVYMFHSLGSTHLQYSKTAFQAYDVVFCNGPQDERELREAERLYSFPEKCLVQTGYNRVENIYREWSSRAPSPASKQVILIAPSWHKGNILESCIGELIATFSKTQYIIIIRPHPETLKRHPEIIRKVKKSISRFPNMFLETKMTERGSMLDATVLITDWSAISFEYAFGTERPVLFINTPIKIANPDYRDLGIEPMEISLRNRIGTAIEPDIIPSILEPLEQLIEQRRDYRGRIIAERARVLSNWLKSDQVAGDYLINCCQSLMLRSIPESVKSE